MIWFEEPEQAIVDPVRFVAYAMTYGMHEDMVAIRRYLSDKDLKQCLKNAPPGIFDGRSWAYWNLKFGQIPVPPIPERKIA